MYRDESSQGDFCQTIAAKIQISTAAKSKGAKTTPATLRVTSEVCYMLNPDRLDIHKKCLCCILNI